VARLVSYAILLEALDTGGIWSIARGLARNDEDGGGLRLVMEPTGSRRWVLRVKMAGKRRNRGVGSYPLVSLDAARDKALDIRGHQARGARRARLHRAPA
jgi:hypothetical protein